MVFDSLYGVIDSVDERPLLGLVYGTLAVFVWPMSALAAKRWHDRDKSGMYVFIYFLPFIGPLWTLIEPGFLSGTNGPNRFGPNPLGVGEPVSGAG